MTEPLSTLQTPTHIIVMGVSGCGKSTLAAAIAQHLGWEKIEGDAFHPLTNVAKMAAGISLTDTDREPWLQTLNEQLHSHQQTVLSCSALKVTYRTLLSQGLPTAPLFVHVHGGYESLLVRLQARHNHFMPASLLRSQFDALELPVELGLACITVSTEQPTALQLSSVLRALGQTS
jgi:carbohydrate kinase (thermoresistant glucokinase family)